MIDPRAKWHEKSSQTDGSTWLSLLAAFSLCQCMCISCCFVVSPWVLLIDLTKSRNGELHFSFERRSSFVLSEKSISKFISNYSSRTSTRKLYDGQLNIWHARTRRIVNIRLLFKIDWSGEVSGFVRNIDEFQVNEWFSRRLGAKWSEARDRVE